MHKVGSPSAFIEVMERAFGFPCELTRESIPVLEGIRAATQDEAFKEVIEKIEEFEEIELYALY